VCLQKCPSSISEKERRMGFYLSLGLLKSLLFPLLGLPFSKSHKPMVK
jgi:hypothetical protein